MTTARTYLFLLDGMWHTGHKGGHKLWHLRVQVCGLERPALGVNLGPYLNTGSWSGQGYVFYNR